MSRSNLILRLIDVVFILLFGFIAVSQIDTTAAIEPPKSTEAEAGTPDGRQTVIIGVTKEGAYLVDGGAQTLKNFNELNAYLTNQARQAEKAGAQIGVRIRANWDSPVEYGLSVATLCNNLAIPKGLDVVSASAD